MLVKGGPVVPLIRHKLTYFKSRQCGWPCWRACCTCCFICYQLHAHRVHIHSTYWLSLRRLVLWINHLLPVYWSTFWKSTCKQQFGCRLDITDNISSGFFCILTWATVYVLIHRIIFRLFLYCIVLPLMWRWIIGEYMWSIYRHPWKSCTIELWMSFCAM